MNEMKNRLLKCGIDPSEKIGQHFLIDDQILNSMAQRVSRGDCVIEVGAGPGNLTEKLIERSSHLVAIEIDDRFQPFLEPLSRRADVEIVYADVLTLDLPATIRRIPDACWDIVASLPFHISEPFLKRVAGLPFEEIVLLIGNTLAHTALTTDPDNPSFSKLSLLCQTFYDPSLVLSVPKTAFYPQPRTDGAIVDFSISPTEKFQNPKYAFYRALFQSERSGSTVAKVLTEVYDPSQTSGKKYIDKKLTRRQSRRALKRELRALTNQTIDAGLSNRSSITSRTTISLGGIRDLGLPERLLSKPFSAYDNSDVKLLVRTLEQLFG